MRHLTIAASVAALAATAFWTAPASAACTRLAFSVNDYGKDGPTKDAKKLLDTYIAKWTAERGIKKYRTGPKDVSCELFLNLIVFDEHTCRAEATVCWDGPAVTSPIQATAPAAGGTQVKPNASPAAPGNVKRSGAPLPAAAPAAVSEPVKVVAPAPVANPATTIETGVVVPAAKPASPPADVAPKAVAAPPAAARVEAPPAKAGDAGTDAALLAAQRAAAAAERAAAAAERAAAAAAAAEKGAAKPQ